MSGGTLIVVGNLSRTLQATGVIKSSSSNGLRSGSHNIFIGFITNTYPNDSKLYLFNYCI